MQVKLLKKYATLGKAEYSKKIIQDGAQSTDMEMRIMEIHLGYFRKKIL